jgi:glycosyltransferase involved in cell wall biosynthesis
MARKIARHKSKRLLRADSYTPTPRLSLLIQSFNHRRNIPDIVAGLRRTSAQEIIVCEDGSIDGSLSVWTKLLDRPNDFVIRSNDLHELRAYDRAMTLARGEIICLMQDDDIPPASPAWLEKSLGLFDRFPDLVMVGGWIGFRSLEACREASDAHPYVPGDIIDVYSRPEFTTDDGLPFMFVPGINIGPVFIRRERFIEMGGFDFSYSPVGWPAIHFDIEMALRVWMKGGQVGWFPMDFHGRGDGGGTKAFGHYPKRLQQLKRNHGKLEETYGAHIPHIQELVRTANRQLRPRQPHD